MYTIRMSKKKMKICVLFGGKSAEHDVSLVSARNVINALDKTKYLVTPIKINRNGKFNLNSIKGFDLVFPVLHGPYGEDGSMQGFLKLVGVPFVGPSILGSAVGMDKDVMKRLLRDNNIPIGDFLVFNNGDKLSFLEAKSRLGIPLFIKPANLGSSVGIHKVKNEKEWIAALKDAFLYDSKIVIEEFIAGREIECSVLGNENPIASIPGEIIANEEFYSYDAKYKGAGSTAIIPAKLDKKTIEKIKNMSVSVFKTLACEGMGRVDFFLKENGDILVNDINTLPGFTAISMYPKLWEASGLSLVKLLDKLINLGLQRFKREQKLKSTIHEK